MVSSAKMGHNLTGAQMSPKDTAKMAEAVEHYAADVPGNASDLLIARRNETTESGRIGSVPVPGSAKGMLKSTFEKMMGKNPEVLIDKLGERLAYERTGVRLYEAAIAKVQALDTGAGAPPDLLKTLETIRNEEEEHFHLLVAAIEKLGADPTAMTPSADVVGVIALGVMQVLTDPRTNISHALNALLTIELADNAAWELLIEMAESAGQKDIAKSFGKAFTQEEQHLANIKALLRQDQLGQLS
ncbi:ferritin-like domain-containing protein [Pseudomonas sp. gcc21]|uniref:ferritin-like domain-containing protein n=1 Tax=Pseudomonas sp. gcc21 TaxID=2726989 RepID=UPI001452979D|nr:ferritin-like domain-containing protein [Pseudomonas sp. gcc21]QJD57541.1 ferritin-like domain-containing protein [Pseudomonas sp. gcc21]